MKLTVLAATALLFIPLMPAGAEQQTPRAATAQRIFNWCMRLPTGSQSECGCVAGYYAAATADDEFLIVGAMVDFITPEGTISDNDAMTASVLAQKAASGITDDRFDEIIAGFATFDQLGDKADGICLPVEAAANASSSHSSAEQ